MTGSNCAFCGCGVNRKYKVAIFNSENEGNDNGFKKKDGRKQSLYM